MCTYGYSYVQNNLTVGNDTTIGGSIAVNSGSVQIKPGFYDPSGTLGFGATMVVNGGVGIAGNVLIGNNLTINNTAYLSGISSTTRNGNLTISSGGGNINIGSYSTVFQNVSANINIGSTSDNVTLFGKVTSSGAMSTSSDKMSVYIDTILSNIQKNAGLTIGGGTIDKIATSYYGYVMTDTNNLGFLLKAPNSNNSVDLLLNSMILNSGTTRGLLTLESLKNWKIQNGYSLPDQYDPSYIISSCPNIDISNLILSTNINSINNVQTIYTSVCISGNLCVSNGNVLINQISTSSSDTSTGAIVVSGGIGVSGNVNIGGYTNIFNTDPYNALSVDGGIFSGGNLSIIGDIFGENINTNSNANIQNDLFVSGYSYINVINGIDNGNSQRILLSMTDFSSNVTFHSTADAYNSTSGSIQVLGGAGIGGNVFVGGNTVIMGKIPSNGTNSGALQVVGGAGISGNVFVGGNTILLGNTNSNGTNSGALQVVGGVGISKDLLIGGNITIGGLMKVSSVAPSVSCYTGVTMGGLGIQGNLFVNNQSYLGSNATLLSGLILYYPFSTDISNYATGTPVSDMVPRDQSWTYDNLSNKFGNIVGPPGGKALDISCITLNNTNSSNYIKSNANFSSIQIQNLTQFTISFWINIQSLPQQSSSKMDIFSFNNDNGIGGGPSSTNNSILYVAVDYNGIIYVQSAIGSLVLIQGTTGFGYSKTQLTVNNWNLLTFNCTLNPNTNGGYSLFTNLYINGVYDANYIINYTSSPLTSFNTLHIGYDNMYNTGVGQGQLCHYLFNDYRLYNRVLVINEIVQLYNSSGLVTWITDGRYYETMILNSDTTTYTTYPSYNTVYTPISFPPNITTAISGNLAVSGFSNLRGNTFIMGDLNVTGYVLQNGTRLGYNVTDSSMIVAGPGGYFGGNLLVGNIYLNTLTLGSGGYFGGSTTSGDISLNRIKLGTGGYFGGSTTNGDISLNHITLGAGGYFGGSTTSGDVSFNHVIIGGSSVSTNPNTGNLQVIGGVGIVGNINVGGATSTFTAGTPSTTTATGALVVTGGGGVGIGGAINVGGATSIFTAGTASTSTGSGTVVVTGGMGISGAINVGGAINVSGIINVGGATSTYTAGTASTSTSTGTVVVTGGVGISGAINVGGATSTYTAGTVSSSTSTGTVVVTGGVGISGAVNVGGATSKYTAGTSSTSTSTGTLVITGGVGISENINVGGATSKYTAGTVSTSTSTGTVVITGGVGISGAINVGGTTSTYTAGTASTSTSTGTLVVTGGVGISGAINVGGTTSTYTAGTSSISTSTGSVVVTGGMGISENIYVGKKITTTNLTITAVDGVNNGTLTIESGSTLKVNDTTVNAVTVSGRGNFGSLAVSNAVTAFSFNATSDYRIKTSITDLDPTFTIDHLRPVKYINIHDSKEYIGFIAHEIQQTYPFLVTGEKDGEETQTMNYDGIIGILVNEIKMLKQRICVLENK
jgi:hypothetical protein